METYSEALATANKVCTLISSSPKGVRRMKLRTLLNQFGFFKRSDSNTAAITTALAKLGISLSSPIVRFGETWDISMNDWIYLSNSIASPLLPVSEPAPNNAPWKCDEWFDQIASRDLRIEKEVEIKFIVPLLMRLGYGDDDRFDGMPIPAANGSRNTTLVIDFALFDSSVEALRHQPLLIVEAKKEKRLRKREEIASAHNQAKSYCLWTQCDFFFVTDSRSIKVFHISRANLADLRPLFECERHELKDRFECLYSIISKDTLSGYYQSKLSL